MNEKMIVDSIVKFWQDNGFKVATEVANFYRSADIAALDPAGKVCVVECKVSNVSRAIEQTKTHKISADKVFVGMPYRNTKQSTFDRLNDEGIGLIYVMPNGSIQVALDVSNHSSVWQLANQRLRNRILEAIG